METKKTVHDNCEALIDNDDDHDLKAEDKEATKSFIEALKNLWRPARWMILNAIFHPIYSVVNAMVLGH